MLFNDQVSLLRFSSLRMVTGLCASLIHLCRLDWTAPDYSTIAEDKSILILQLTIKKAVMVSSYSSIYLLKVSRRR